MSADTAKTLLGSIAAIVTTLVLITLISGRLIHFLLLPMVIVVLVWSAAALDRG